MNKAIIVFCLLFLVSCDSHQNMTTSTMSTAFTTLAEKEAFLEQYVQFDRHYVALDYSIDYHDNSGGLIPGPSDWAILIVAQVPPDDVEQWIGHLPGSNPPASPPTLPMKTAIDYSGVSDWYREGGRLVGVDHSQSVIVYLNSSR